MTQASFFHAAPTSRLVRFLNDLDLVGSEPSYKRFGERLGQLIDLSDSFALSDAHYRISKIRYEKGEQTPESIQEEFLRVRSFILGTIAKSFSPDAKTRFKAPKLNFDNSEELLKFEPYRRFYAIQQREMDIQIQSLRGFVREGVSGLSQSLAQLAALDKALSDTLQVHTAKALVTLPKRLAQHFEQLFEGLDATTDPAHLKQQFKLFYRDMQGLLLAECELRMQPIVGLIEAMNHEDNV